MNENTRKEADFSDVELKVDRLDELLSLIIDDNITDAEVHELGAMLEDNPQARQRYVEGMQLHADLIQHFHPERGSGDSLVSPVLGLLDTSDSDVAMPPSISGDSAE